MNVALRQKLADSYRAIKVRNTEKQLEGAREERSL